MGENDKATQLIDGLTQNVDAVSGYTAFSKLINSINSNEKQELGEL